MNEPFIELDPSKWEIKRVYWYQGDKIHATGVRVVYRCPITNMNWEYAPNVELRRDEIPEELKK